MALQFAHNILAERGIVCDSKKGRAELKVCDIFYDVSADTAVDVLHMTCVSSVRDINILRETFDIHKNCS